MSELAEPAAWRFDEFVLDPEGGILFRVHPDGQTSSVHIGSRALQLLCLLVKRRGAVVAYGEIMDAVWPHVTVGQNNVSVQVATLRRLLEANGGRGSCIQNVPGRGYRFASQVSDHARPSRETNMTGDDGHLPSVKVERLAPVSRQAGPRLLPRRLALVTLCLLGLGALLAAVAFRGVDAPFQAENATAALPPAFSPGEEALRRRLTLVVLPFENLGGDGLSNATVDAITGDVTTELAHVPILAVAARNLAMPYKGLALETKRIGQELGVRYVLQGNVRTSGRALQLNVQLVSVESNEHLWAERFDASPDTIDALARTIMTAVRFRLIETENARSLRERPRDPGFADIMLRAMYHQHNLAPNPQNRAAVLSLYERVVQLDPASVLALAGMAEALLDSIYVGPRDNPNARAMLRKAEDLVRRAETLRPDHVYLMFVKVGLLGMQNRCSEAVPTARRAIELHPSVSTPYYVLGICSLIEGRAAEAVQQFEQSIRVHPRNPQVWNRHLFRARALIELARYDEAMQSLNAAVASLPSASNTERRGALYGWIAATQVLASRLGEAHATAAEARRIWPMLTVRSFYPWPTVQPAHAAQVARVLDALRMAGLRDHADEDADHGLESDAVLRSSDQAPTPTSVPGARTLRTPDLAVLLTQRTPLVLDTRSFGKSIPGAIGLPGAGTGGAVWDEYQDRLKQKLVQLTRGDRSMPIVTMGFNAERFEGRNLALRLAALGYTDIYWYRGGREAWEVAGLPMTEVAAEDW